jgi:hypothetical protein
MSQTSCGSPHKLQNVECAPNNRKCESNGDKKCGKTGFNARRRNASTKNKKGDKGNKQIGVIGEFMHV